VGRGFSILPPLDALSDLFTSITANITTSIIPAVLVAISAVVIAGLVIFGAKFGIRAVKSFFGVVAK
jgi:hypothetical protein